MKTILLASAALLLSAAPTLPQSSTPAGASQHALANRAPQPTDDARSGLADGAFWLRGTDLFQLIDNTAGFAMWQAVGSGQLPLDVFGLHVSAAEVAAGGRGYALGDTVTLPGGAVLTVAGLAGSAIARVTVRTPDMHACAPENPVAPLATSGAGNGASFTLTLLKPYGYGTRRLSRCYGGNAMTLVRSDTGAAQAIGFLADGSLDIATADAFAGATPPMASYAVYNTAATPRVAVWNDQGGNAADATGAAGTQPTLFPGRSLGNARSVMFDARGNHGAWDAPASYLTLPGSVAVNPAALTMAVLAGAETYAFVPLGWLHIGCLNGGCLTAGIEFNAYVANTMECDNGAAPNVSAGQLPTDTPFLSVCSMGASGTVADMLNATASSAAGGRAGTVSGGAIGAPGTRANPAGGLVDIAAAVIVPWDVSAATRAAFEASIYQTFGVVPQGCCAIVALGDSHVDGWGATFQQSWPRALATLLNRPDVRVFNASRAGAPLSKLVAGASWNALVAPALARRSGFDFVILQGCYNDLGSGQTVDQCEASYTLGISETHAAGARAICVADVIRRGPPTLNRQMQEIGAWIRSGAAGCDAVIDLQSYPAFNQAAGPWPLPWFEQQDGGVHLSAAGNALVAEIAARTVAGLLP